MPIKAATVETTACETVFPSIYICLLNKSIPTGTIKNDIVEIILFKLLIISEETAFIYLVSLEIFAV